MTARYAKRSNGKYRTRFRRKALCLSKSTTSIAQDQFAAEISAELAADHLRQIRKLDDFAYALLRGADGDPIEAEKSLEDFIDLLFEGGALSMWRFRIVLAKIREGL